MDHPEDMAASHNKGMSLEIREILGTDSQSMQTRGIQGMPIPVRRPQYPPLLLETEIPSLRLNNQGSRLDRLHSGVAQC
jgi:hypothetical protein